MPTHMPFSFSGKIPGYIVNSRLGRVQATGMDSTARKAREVAFRDLQNKVASRGGNAFIHFDLSSAKKEGKRYKVTVHAIAVKAVKLPWG